MLPGTKDIFILQCYLVINVLVSCWMIREKVCVCVVHRVECTSVRRAAVCAASDYNRQLHAMPKDGGSLSVQAPTAL